ncbi:CLUMA_CG009684, isoform A [Clunio marinus]|uniref:CLUMA_CG009684, isoform A n=1 Tax=Clunio marinus TaxID=568069 RepID=A0A1J1I7U5_9DIPT|nr:CLUMA_CG009684, isoform A [Clunio marinus]
MLKGKKYNALQVTATASMSNSDFQSWVKNKIFNAASVYSFRNDLVVVEITKARSEKLFELFRNLIEASAMHNNMTTFMCLYPWVKKKKTANVHFPPFMMSIECQAKFLSAMLHNPSQF